MSQASLPQITTAIHDFSVTVNAPNANLNLFHHFDDPSTTGKVARFELEKTSLGGGIINVLLFDQAGAGAPLTVGNFQSYVTAGRYTNSIIHRSVPGFIVQGGGFTLNGLRVGTVTTVPPVRNEFSVRRSNLRGTIAMAKLGGDPNSATSQWFFNLGNNAANLDNQNGGFTVFGEVLSTTDLGVIDAIARIPIFNGTRINPAFSDLPLDIDPRNPRIDNDNDFLRFRQISITNRPELTFSVVSNSNPSLVIASINNNQLTLDYRDNQTGTANIRIRATNLLGNSIEDTFQVSVRPNLAPTDLRLLNSTIAENQPIGTAIGNLSTLDANPDDAFTYSLVAGTGATDNGAFTIVGNQLKSNLTFNFEATRTYSIRVRTTDRNGLFFEKTLTITITNQSENSILGTNTNNTLNGTANSDRLEGLDGADTLNGLGGNDDLYGGNGNDRLDGGSGIDALFGGLGNDVYLIENQGDRIIENANEGTDTVYSPFSYTLGLNVENLVLQGTGALNGTGNSAHNQITGNRGNNRLNGGAGADTLTGGAGADTLIFQFGQSTLANPDRLLDFAIGTDKIHLLTSSGLALNTPIKFTRAGDRTTTTLTALVNQVFTDANGALTGNQVLGVNSAVLARVTTGAIAGTYLVINDKVAGFQSNSDLVIALAGFTGTLPPLGNIAMSVFFA